MKQKRKQFSVTSRDQLLALKKKWALGCLDLRRKWRYHPVYNVLSSRRKKKTAFVHHQKQQEDEERVPEWVQSIIKEKIDPSSSSNIENYKETECSTHRKLPKQSSTAATLKKSCARNDQKEPVQVEGVIRSVKNRGDSSNSKTGPGSPKNSEFKFHLRKRVAGQYDFKTKHDQFISKLSAKEEGHFSLEKDDGSSTTVVILNSCKGKRSRTLQCRATATTLDHKRKHKCRRFHRKRHSYFMMYKTFPLVPLYHNTKCQKIRKRRNKFKQQLNECRFTGFPGNCEEKLDYTGANVVSSLETEDKAAFKGLKYPLNLCKVNVLPEHKESHLSRFFLNGKLAMFQHSEMNFSGIGPQQESLSTDGNMSTSPRWSWSKNMECQDGNSLCSEQGSDVPVEDSCDSDPYLDEMYFDEVHSPVNMDVAMDDGSNSDSCLQGTSSNNGSNKLKLNEGAQNCTQMEIDHVKNTDIFATELIDHLYCKNPHEAPTSADMKCRLESDLREKEEKGIKSSVTSEQLTMCINDFLDEFLKKYGSLIPLCEKDILTRLKEVFNEDFSNRRSLIIGEIMKYRKSQKKKNTSYHFQVNYNKHVLEVEDLATLAGQNWLNDQVINMYGELIMDAVPDTVHFFNSFFHKQLVTRGYNGVKRWTKKVELFKKKLLLIPIHLEVHWSLITVDIPKKIISFYDSQGIHFKFCVENIRKYLYTEAKEKNHPEFLDGWQTTITKCIPQQKNSSDCGVFVLQYCKCLALGQPFHFSQEDMPRVRRRIYKELCECKLMD